MQLTQEVLNHYIGGQLEVRQINTAEIIRGHIQSISLDGFRLTVILDWSARTKRLPGIRNWRSTFTSWKSTGWQEFHADLKVYKKADMSHGGMCIELEQECQFIIFYPPRHPKLIEDPRALR